MHHPYMKNTDTDEAISVKRIRRSLGMTQATLAKTLGVSIRAIQSYEQGWRETPTPLMMQLLVLLAAYRSAERGEKPCWEVTKCSAENRLHCPCRYTAGSLCWLVSGRMCGITEKDEAASLETCLNCPVVHRLLAPADANPEA